MQPPPYDPTYNIAEDFISPQGEGTHTDRLMYFFRFAGCNVGVPFTTDRMREALPADLALAVINNPGHTVCTSVTGQMFLCDTNYKATMKVRLSNFFARMKSHAYHAQVRDVCLTGGEPFMFDLQLLVDALHKERYRIHIETSGTKPIPAGIREKVTHICCSPKLGYLPENGPYIDAFKFVVDPAHDRYDRLVFAQTCDMITRTNPKAEVYIQPVNDVAEVNLLSLLEITNYLLPARPEWRLSLQLHKMLRVR